MIALYSVTVLPYQLEVFLIFLIMIYTSVKLVCVFNSEDFTKPMQKNQRDLVSSIIAFGTRQLLLWFNLKCSRRELSWEDVDYKFYLGDNYKDLYVAPRSNIVPTYFINH